MAAPSKRALTSFVNGLSATSPSSTAIGDLVVVFTISSTTVTGIPTHTLQSGYSQIGTGTADDGATDARLSVAYIVATAAGAQSYQAYTASTGTSSTGILVLQAGTFDVSSAPQWQTTSSTSNAAPNPPAATSLTGDFMVLAIGVWVYASSTANTPTAPANYALEDHLAGSQIHDIAYCSRSLTGLSGATEDPAAITDNTAPACTIAATIAISGALAISASVSATLDAATSSGEADVAVAGSTAATLDAATATGEADVAVAASAGPTLDAVTSDADGAVEVKATSAPTLDSATLDADATVGESGVSGSVIQTLGGVGFSSMTIVEVKSSAAVTLDGATSAASSAVAVAAQSTPTLDAATSDAGAQVAVDGAAGVQLAGAMSSAAVAVVIESELGKTLEDATVDASASSLPEITATAAAQLGEAVVDAEATVADPSDPHPLITLGALGAGLRVILDRQGGSWWWLP